jgi:hypothetical protein
MSTNSLVVYLAALVAALSGVEAVLASVGPALPAVQLTPQPVLGSRCTTQWYTLPHIQSTTTTVHVLRLN